MIPGNNKELEASPGTYRLPGGPVLLAMALAVLVRVALLTLYRLDTGLPLSSVVNGHDGAEYVAFARALAHGEIAGIPEEARRHDPGLALILAPFVRIGSGELSSWLVTLGALLAAVALYWTLLSRYTNTSHRQAALLVVALPLVYPTQVYYSCFVLTEPLFLLTLLASTLLFLQGKHRLSYGLAGLLTCVRATGIFLVPALFFADLLVRRDWRPDLRRLSVPFLALLLPLAWAATTAMVWEETNVGILQPVFSFPFSGFAGLREVGTVRAVYVLLAVTFFILSAVRLAREAAGERWQSPFLNLAVLFCAAFLLFHLCLESLYYLNRTIYTFNYQDRYYVPLLPFALYAWRNWLRPWNIAGAAVVSVALSFWWGHNYFQARGF